MPRARRRAQPEISDAVAFYLTTGWHAPKGRFATVWDALLIPEHATPELRRTHHDELVEWEAAHPECWQEARVLEAKDAEAEAHATRAPLGYGAPHAAHENEEK